MSNKKYYWLKLNDNFFEEDTIVWLEEQENGKDYVNFYLKLLLKSLREEGKLVRYVGERVMPYDHKSLAKLTNVSIDTVAVAMRVFIDIGLVEQLDTGELFLTQIDEMIGSETAAAQRMRRLRARENTLLNKAISTDRNNVQKCYEHIEIEKEIEKELEIEKPSVPSEKEQRFKEFWEAYPKKVNKKRAMTAYNKISKKTHDIIMKDLETRVDSDQWKKDKGKYIPNPTTYLNGERWNDEVEVKESVYRVHATLT